MTSEFQAGKLILSQIKMFNEAAILFDNEVQPAVLRAIDECIKAFANDDQWVGIFELADDINHECWLAPAQWSVGRKKDRDVAKAKFEIETFNDHDDSWTSLLCGHGSQGGEAGFMFNVDSGIYGAKGAWSKYLRSTGEKITELNGEKIAELKKKPVFKFVDNEDGRLTFFLPICLDSEKLAEVWGTRGAFAASDDCFEPVKAALEKLKSAWPIFDGILKAWPVKA